MFEELKELKKLRELKTILLPPIIYAFKTIVFNSFNSYGRESFRKLNKQSVTMTTYFTINELTRSNVAMRLEINNMPDQTTLKDLRSLIANVLDPLRRAWGAPIIVTSGYRCPRLNKIVGGVPHSQHVLGQAADIRTVDGTPAENRRLFQLVKELKLPFDQLIDEYNYAWVHVSYGPRHRRQVLHLR